MADKTDKQSMWSQTSIVERKRRRNTNEPPSSEKLVKKSKNIETTELDADIVEKIIDFKSIDENIDTETPNDSEKDDTIAESCPETSWTEIPTGPLKITDLSVDCWAHVLKYLNLIDLLNIADLDENATEAANLVFERRFSNKVIKMVGLETPKMIEFEEFAITTSKPSICSKLLIVFGESIKKLQFEYLSNEHLTHDWAEVRNLINNNYAKNVVELKLTNCEEKIIDGIEKPFEKVLRLQITCSRLGDRVNLGKWFPNLDQLELLHNNSCTQIVSDIPYLSYLAMDTENACLSTSNFQMMIKSLPQLQTLSLSGGMESSLLRFIGENCANLKRLFLWDFYLEDEPEDKVVFESVETLSISTGWLGILPPIVPFEFQKLAELRLSADTLDEEWIDFAMQQRNLAKLQLNSILEPEIDDNRLAELASALTKLTELDVIADISPDGLAHFLADCKTLKKLRIKKFNQTDYGSYRRLEGAVWRSVRNEHGLTFERKAE